MAGGMSYRAAQHGSLPSLFKALLLLPQESSTKACWDAGLWLEAFPSECLGIGGAGANDAGLGVAVVAAFFEGGGVDTKSSSSARRRLAALQTRFKV